MTCPVARTRTKQILQERKAWPFRRCQASIPRLMITWQARQRIRPLTRFSGWATNGAGGGVDPDAGLSVWATSGLGLATFSTVHLLKGSKRNTQGWLAIIDY